MAITKIKGASMMESFTAGFTTTTKISTSKVGDSFSSALDKAGENLQPNIGDGKGAAASKADAGPTVENAANSAMDQRGGDTSAKGVKTDTETVIKDEMQIKDPVTEAVERIAEEIRDELGITDEQLKEAMEVLGITMMDLVKPEAVTALVTEITGTEAADILTDETLTKNVMDILSVQREEVGKLMQKLDVTPEEFKELVDTGKLVEFTEEEKAERAMPDIGAANETENENIQVTVTKDTPDTWKYTQINTEVTDENKETAGTTSETVITSQKAVKTDGQPETVIEDSGTAENGESKVDETILTTTNSKITTDDFAEDGDEAADSFGKHLFDDKTEMKPKADMPKGNQTVNAVTSFQQNLTNAVADAAGVEEAQTAQTMTTAQRVADILDQIQNQIKISANQETTTLEMQLNPASLGKVALHIESKAGVVSAQFEAQNATVKAAIESQITQLREALETKGIKVNEVEVTVSSHAFEQNLMNGQSGGQNFRGDTQGSERSARLRRINLNSRAVFNGAEAVETEDEASELAKKIMIDSGNSVDFTA